MKTRATARTRSLPPQAEVQRYTDWTGEIFCLAITCLPWDAVPKIHPQTMRSQLVGSNVQTRQSVLKSQSVELLFLLQSIRPRIIQS